MEVFHALAEADVLHGNAELVADANDYATLGSAVEFGDSECVDFGGGDKLLSLFKGVLSGRAVKHEQHLVRSIGQHLFHGVFDFGELVHKAHIVVQTSGGVDNHHVGILCLGACHGVVGHRCRVGAHLVLDNRHTNAFAPNFELFVGSGTISVGGTEHHLVASLCELVGEFADCSGFSHSVDTHHHDDVGFLVVVDGEILAVGVIVVGEQLCNLLAEHIVEFVG